MKSIQNKWSRIIRFNFTSILILISFALLFFCCKQKVAEKDQNAKFDAQEGYAQLEFIEDFFDFGSIKQGEVVSYTFKLTNTGNMPLIINDIVPECGCTKSKLSHEVIKPNEMATIEVIFDSSGWRGVQFKSVTIRTNGKTKEKSVTIKANVVT